MGVAKRKRFEMLADVVEPDRGPPGGEQQISTQRPVLPGMNGVQNPLSSGASTSTSSTTSSMNSSLSCLHRLSSEVLNIDALSDAESGWEGSSDEVSEFPACNFSKRNDFPSPDSCHIATDTEDVEEAASFHYAALTHSTSSRPNSTSSTTYSLGRKSSPSGTAERRTNVPLDSTNSTSSAGTTNDRRRASPSCVPAAKYRWKWTLLIWCHLSQILAGGLLKSLAVFLDDILQEFDSSVAFMGWMFSLEAFFFGVTCPFASLATKKLGPRCVMMAGGIINSVGIMVAFLATNVVMVGAGISVIAGIGSSLIYVAALVTVRRHFSTHYALANGITLSGVSVAVFIFPPIIRVLINHFGWRGALFIISAISLNAVVTGALMKGGSKPRNTTKPANLEDAKPQLPASFSSRMSSPQWNPCPDEKAKSDWHPCKEHCLSTKSECSSSKRDLSSNDCKCTKEYAFPHDSRHGGKMPLQSVYTNGTIVVKPLQSTLVVSGGMPRRLSIREKYAMHLTENVTHGLLCVVVMLWSASNTAVMKYLVAAGVERGMSSIQGAVLLSSTGVASCATLFGHGIFISRGWMTPLTLYLVMFVVMAVAEFSLALFQRYITGIVSAAVFGLGTGAITSLNLVVQRSLDGRAGVQATGWLIFVEGVAGALGGYCMGAIRDVSGSYKMSFTACGVLTSAAACVVILIAVIRRVIGVRQRRTPCQSASI
ncbi:monocarboxylate transporter 12-like [Diadema antillarum]|uniref:monocarboxylate transporter 12-like n=1 Tax=Diadema antillarum TaxID=105358 RepID=UPI003A8601A8